MLTMQLYADYATLFSVQKKKGKKKQNINVVQTGFSCLEHSFWNMFSRNTVTTQNVYT